jgi:hypothetical protein
MPWLEIYLSKMSWLEPYLSIRKHGARDECSEDKTLFLGLLRPQLMRTKGHRHTQLLNMSQTVSLIQVERNIFFSEDSHILRPFATSAPNQEHVYNPDSEETGNM